MALYSQSHANGLSKIPARPIEISAPGFADISPASGSDWIESGTLL
jgi:hypothetical protein